jgi:3-oxoacyl-[acyl-carrier protein] reductase
MLIMLTKCLARALAPAVRVNSIAPGYVATRWLDQVFPSAIRDELLSRAPTPPAAPEQIAQAALTLLENDAINGATLVVDGGELLY